MTALADRITGADVIWIRRSVVRVERREHDADLDNFEASVAPSIVREPKVGNAPVVDLRARISVETRTFEAVFEVLVRFILGEDRDEPSEAEGAKFMRDYAFDYAFGFLRTALVDDLRMFGFPPGIMPVDALNDVKAIDFKFSRGRETKEPA